ncbi:hypothetical protein [Dyadobacter sp. Leaf189]|uniref:hypothetical protein n=1 Tax=Dyadobacter sp. Leaf189 TaxID=1736295 RepID=UPI0006F4922A|nr:hypothetical protein [Dyadobacter sp. Leaf189]KQS24860.1 hypothetical protein ASG33_24270 [Dyadobacter sp. Leaf189]
MNNPALFKILYQDETLFYLGDIKTGTQETVARVEKAPESAAVQTNVTATPAKPATPPKPAIPATPAIPVAAPEFPQLRHKILILIDEPKQEEMLASEAAFLNNILKAVGHSTDHSDILNFSFLSGTDATKVFRDKKTNYFITFGVPLIKLHLDLLLPPYTPKNIEGVWFLLTDPLVVIEADRNLKKKLWQALQKMFEVS